MIIVKIMGGIGNQMFQYAMGRNLALMKNTTLKLDITWFNHFNETTTPRYYSLPEFNIVENIASDKEIKEKRKYRVKMGRRHFFHNHFIADKSVYISERQFNFNKDILDVSDDVYLIGYWQSEKYFENIKNIIRQEFTLKNNPSDHYKKYLQKIKNAGTNSIAIHVRRGDYMVSQIRKNIGLCPIDYYYSAIEKMCEKIKNPTFFIFSDDTNWVKDNLKIKFPMEFVSDNKTNQKNKNTDYEELTLMSKCGHNIIANSSFSWWGAWLNTNPNKIVIAKRKWFQNRSINTGDIIPKKWLKI